VRGRILSGSLMSFELLLPSGMMIFSDRLLNSSFGLWWNPSNALRIWGVSNLADFIVGRA